MSLLDYLTRNKKNTAAVAKERLQIILSHQHGTMDGPEFLPALKEELLEVVKKYAQVRAEDIVVELDREGDCEILEVNISLPGTSRQKTA